MKNFTRIIGYGIAAFVSSVVLAQQPAAVATTPVVSSDMTWYFNENIEIHTFKDEGSSLVGLNQNFGLDLNNGFVFHLNAPVYSQDSLLSFGDLSLDVSWDFLKGKNSVLGEWGLSVGAGTYIPVGQEYFRSQNFNPFVSAEFDCKVSIFDFAQTAEYRFDGGESYITWLGAKTDSDVLTLGTDLSYKFDAFKVGVKFDQIYYVNTVGKQLFLGPVAEWNIANNINLSMGVLIPVYQDVATHEADVVITAGIGIKF